MSERAEYRVITSLTNDTVKAVRALHMRKERDQTGTFLAEGLKFIGEALDQGRAPRMLLVGEDRRDLIAQARPMLTEAEVLELQRSVSAIHASDALVNYVQALLTRSRQHPGVRIGLSPRAGLALLRAARAHALLLGRSHVLPEDVQTLFVPLAAHRLVGDGDAGDGAQLAKSVLLAVPVD